MSWLVRGLLPCFGAQVYDVLEKGYWLVNYIREQIVIVFVGPNLKDQWSAKQLIRELFGVWTFVRSADF